MNIYYHYTNHGRSLFRGFAFTLIGIAIIMWPAEAVKAMLLFIGALLVVSGALSIGAGRATEGKWFSKGSLLSVTGTICLVLGILVLCCTNFFLSLMMYFFGVVLVLVGLIQFLSLLSMQTYAHVSLLQYLIPILVFTCGIICFVDVLAVPETLVLMFGIVLTSYGASEIYNAWKFRKAEYGSTIEDTEIIENE